MNQAESDALCEKANKLFLETLGHYSPSADNWVNNMGAGMENVPSSVFAPIDSWTAFVNTVGIENVRCLLGTVFGEINALQNHWALTNYYRALSSGQYALDQVIDLFNRLEEGHRVSGAREFVQRYKANTQGNVETTLPALGVFASYLVVASTFVQNLYAQLDQFNSGYYSRLCEVGIESLTLENLRLSFSKRSGTTALLPVRQLEHELPIICSGSARLLLATEHNTMQAKTAALERVSQVVTTQFLSRFTNQEVSY